METFVIPDHLKRKQYETGFRYLYRLKVVISKHIVICYLPINGVVSIINCHLDTKEMSMVKLDEIFYLSVPHKYEIKEKDIIDLGSSGIRWEGPSWNQKPFGFGNYYDMNGVLLYTGFMVKKHTVGFGTFYYPGTTVVKYIGTHIEGIYSGYGKLFDQYGSLVYDGEWIEGCVLNTFSLNESQLTDEYCIHSQLKRVVIGDYSFSDEFITTVSFIGYAFEELSIGSNCFPNVTTVDIISCEYLNRLVIGSYSFYSKGRAIFDNFFTIYDCPQLKSVHFDSKACAYFQFSIKCTNE